MNCYNVVYQLKSDRLKYEFLYKDDYVRASSEQEVKNQLKDVYKNDLYSVNKIKLSGLWSDFQKEMNVKAD